MAQVNLKEAYIRYLNSLNSGCDDEIEKEKYNLLFEASDLFEVEELSYTVLDVMKIIPIFQIQINGKLHRINHKIEPILKDRRHFI